MIHIGHIIEKVLREKRFPITEFAKKINTNRNNIYDIFKRDTIDTGLLLKICEVLEHNFFSYLASEISSDTSESEQVNILNNSIIALNKRIEELEKELKTANSQLKDKELIIELIKKKQPKR